jgi:hypothetical protein
MAVVARGPSTHCREGTKPAIASRACCEAPRHHVFEYVKIDGGYHEALSIALADDPNCIIGGTGAGKNGPFE